MSEEHRHRLGKRMNGMTDLSRATSTPQVSGILGLALCCTYSHHELLPSLYWLMLYALPVLLAPVVGPHSHELTLSQQGPSAYYIKKNIYIRPNPSNKDHSAKRNRRHPHKLFRADAEPNQSATRLATRVRQTARAGARSGGGRLAARCCALRVEIVLRQSVCGEDTRPAGRVHLVERSAGASHIRRGAGVALSDSGLVGRGRARVVARRGGKPATSAAAAAA